MTKQCGKLLIKNEVANTYLVVYRANHPVFGNSIDIPGGLVEEGETVLEATLREVFEEIRIRVSGTHVKLLKTSSDYSSSGMEYSLFYTITNLGLSVTLSWEHESHAWVSKQELIDQARRSNDNYMHMVADVVEAL